MSLPRSRGGRTRAARSAVALLYCCVALVLSALDTGAAIRHATSASHGGAASARSARIKPQAGRARGTQRELRRSFPSKALARHRHPRYWGLRRADRHQHPRPPPHGSDARYLASLPHRVQKMPEGQPLPGPVPGQILVLLDRDRPISLGRELARAYGLERIGSELIALLGARAELMAVRRARFEEVLEALRRDPRVRSAQPNQRYLHLGATAGPRARLAEAGLPSAPDGDAPIPQYGPRKLGLPAAHDLALGRNVVIAVIDSAIDTGHPELAGAIARSFNAAGQPDARLDYHGTAVAGLIRGHGLVEGAAPQSELLAVRAFKMNDEATFHETTTDVLIRAVDWAVRNGARILNMSFVGAHDSALQQVLRTAGEKGVIVIAAAGNGGPAAPPAYPAAYPGVIAVTAVDEADRRYEHANRGSYIAVAAPGVDVLAPVERGGYAYVSGTSFAAAYVSGVAALLLERDPNLDPRSVADLLATAAEHLGPNVRNDDFGAGRVDAYKALKLLANARAAKRGDLARP
jgi:subtilisin family serine protease